MSVNDVIRYYTDLHSHYLNIWGAARHHGIHYGYYDQYHRTHNAAVVNMNCILAERIRITPRDTVLDAGCGIGGSSIWLAKHIGARVTGLSITPLQIEVAKSLANKHNVAHLVDFQVADYRSAPLPDGSFDVVWGLESVCYAEDKSDFLREAYRLLKPGGRLIVADGWLNHNQLRPKEKTDMRGWLDGWAVTNLATVQDFTESLQTAVFHHADYHDISPQVMPSSRYMFNLYRLFSPIGFFLGRVRIWSTAHINNMIGTYYQHLTLKQGLWSYGIFTAEK